MGNMEEKQPVDDKEAKTIREMQTRLFLWRKKAFTPKWVR